MRTVVEEYNLIYRVGVLLIALLIGLLMYGLAVWAWDSPAELGAYDMLLRMRPAPPLRTDIAVLAIDEQTIAEMGQLPWSRAEHARVIRALRDAGARNIVYDMMFVGPDTEHPGADRALWRAMLDGRDVFMPMVYDPFRTTRWNPADLRALFNLENHAITERISYTPETPTYRYYYFLPPWADFVGAASGIGVAAGTTAPGDVVRRARLAFLTEVTYPVPTNPLPRDITLPELTGRTVVLQGLPLVVSKAVFGVEGERTQVNFGESVNLLANLDPFVRIPVDQAGAMLINYAGPAGTYPNYSVVDLLRGRLQANAFRDRTVFVGITDYESPFPAVLPTPYGPMPRVEITANSVSTILSRTYILRDTGVALVTLIALALIVGLAFPAFDIWRLGPVAFFSVLAYILIALLALIIFNTALPVIPAVVLIILSAVGAALIKPVLFVAEVERPRTMERAA